MAIQLRRGAYENFDPQKMKPAEVGVVQSGDPTSADGKAVYVAIQPGDAKRMASLDELEDYNDQSEAILQQVQAQNTTIQQVYQRTNQRATEAEQAASDAEQLKKLIHSNLKMMYKPYIVTLKVLYKAIQQQQSSL